MIEWVFYMIFVMLGTVLGLFASSYKQGRFLDIILSAFVARILGAVLFKRVVGVADIADYQPYYVAFVDALNSGRILSFLAEGVPVYTIIYPGWVFAVFGPKSYVLIRLFNAVLSVLVIVPLNMISEQVWDRELTRWQLVLVLFWPSYAIFSVDIGRTALGVILPIATLALALKYFQDTNRLTVLFVFLAVAVLNAANRIHYAFYLVMFVVGMYTYKSVYQSSRRFGVGLMTITGSVSFIAIVVYNRLFISVLSVDTIRDYAMSQATGGSVYLPELYPSSMVDLVWYLPIQAFYFLFSPLPWDILQIGSPLAFIAGSQSILLLLLLSSALLFRTDRITRDWRIFSLVVAVVLTAFGFGAVTKNAGAAVRWRLPSALILLVVTTNLLGRDE
jgi:hypothetical protein